VNRRNYLIFGAYLVAMPGVSWSQFEGAPVFFRAVDLDNAATVRDMLERGFDPNTPSEKGQLPLYLAMREGSFRVADLLLAQPQLRVDAANAAGETALMMAALRGHVEWVRRLLDRGAALEREGWTPLHYAASGEGTAAVALLLDRGARIDAPSANRSTALMMASRYGPEASVELLLARGASLALRNDLGLGAVDFARLGGREALAARLQKATR